MSKDSGTPHKILGQIEFTDEQRKQIASVAGRDVRRAQLVELSREEANRLAPGILRASAIVMCW